MIIQGVLLRPIIRKGMKKFFEYINVHVLPRSAKLILGIKGVNSAVMKGFWRKVLLLILTHTPLHIVHPVPPNLPSDTATHTKVRDS